MSEASPSRAPRSGWDWLRLGQTSGQRSAEIVAGIRALTFPSPEALGLSSPSGRWYGQLLLRLNGDRGISNATGARHLSLTHLADHFLAERGAPKVLVEMAAGFSARAVSLARKYPQTKVIEIDRPAVIETKQARLRQMWGDDLPKNLYWLSADLAVTELTALVGEQAVGVVISEGVLPYFTSEEISRIAASVRACLTPNGAMITDIVSAVGWKVVENQSGLATWLLRRQVGQFKGAMPSAEAVRQLFQQAGYAYVAVGSLKDVARDAALKVETADTSFLVVAHNLEGAKA